MGRPQAVDYNRADVKKVLDEYKQGTLKTLRELQEAIGELTGTKPSLSSLSRLTSGITQYTVKLQGRGDRRREANEDESWPVYSQEYICSVKALPIADLAGTTVVPEEKMCKSIPQIRITGEEMKVSYLVDHSHVPAVDVCTDNLGIWNSKHRSMTTTTHFVKGPENLGEGTNCDYVVRKRTYNHVNARPVGSIRKVVWTLYGADGAAFRSLLSYHIGEGAEIFRPIHVNAKTTLQVYKPNPSSTLRRMIELQRTLTPREALEVVMAEQGGIPGASNSQSLPRNRTQLYNASRSKMATSEKSEETTNNGNLMHELFKLSENAMEGSDVGTSYEASTDDLALATSQEDASVTMNFVETMADNSDAAHIDSDMAQIDSSQEMTSSEFETQLLDRLDAVPVGQKAEVRAKIEHELDILFAQKVAGQVERLFEQGSRRVIMERLLSMATP
ncbi:unnamed protein product [Toxocara canis]|uniref:Major sperm protein n=1 Tax=Toxocara canis TaxID=6265 RepID=A0A183V9M2_TOXCA|nr:unnamed protein product [Toxocara canis]